MRAAAGRRVENASSLLSISLALSLSLCLSLSLSLALIAWLFLAVLRFVSYMLGYSLLKSKTRPHDLM